MSENVTKILCITLSNIGDVVMTTPVMSALHAKYPNAVMDIVGDERSSGLFKHLPYLGEVFHKQKRATFKQNVSFIRTLRRKHYDIAVDLRTDGLLYFLKAKQRFHKLTNRDTLKIHSVEKHFAVFRGKMGSDIPATSVALSAKEEGVASLFLEEAQYKSGPILALGLGANFEGKIWPVSRFVELALALKEQFPSILLVGSQKDALLAEAFESAMDHSDTFIMNACGQFDLLTTAALLKRATYFVGNDSGLGHLAGAVSVPSFTVFGVGEPHRYRPWGDHALWYQDPNHEIAQMDGKQIAKAILDELR